MTENKINESKTIQKQYNALFYKEKPLVRHDSILYYGFPSDKYILKLEILDKKMINDFETSNRVIVELIDISGKFEKMIKRSEKNGLYAALEIGSIWLDRALNEK